MGVNRGVVGRVSEESPGRFQWKIPGFLSLRAWRKDFYESPVFTAWGCRWKLGGYPEGRHYHHGVELHLQMLDSELAGEMFVTWTLAFKDLDAGLMLKKSHCENFSKGSRCWFRRPYISRGFLEQEKDSMLPSGTLTVTCSIDAHPKTYKAPPVVDWETLSSNFDSAFSSRKKCDVTLKVKEMEFQAHWFILAARSPVFAAMLEHDTSEQRTGVVTIEDCDPDIFEDFLHYLYTGLVERISDGNVRHLYATAHKYDVQQLRSSCFAYMTRNLNAENVLDIITLAKLYDDSRLMDCSQAFFNRNFYDIIETCQWESLMKQNFPFANGLLKAMRGPLDETGDSLTGNQSKKVEQEHAIEERKSEFGYTESESESESENRESESEDVQWKFAFQEEFGELIPTRLLLHGHSEESQNEKEDRASESDTS